jgi:hypothetical protein
MERAQQQLDAVFDLVVEVIASCTPAGAVSLHYRWMQSGAGQAQCLSL